jgi:hypothetical protein
MHCTIKLVALKILKHFNIVMLTEFIYQGSTAEESLIQKLNQGVCTDVLKYHPCLNFFGYFLFSRKESDKTHFKQSIY